MLTRETATKTVLLGNGFSIDFDPAIFLYESLAKEAELPGLSVGKKRLFESLSSENFEIVIDNGAERDDLIARMGWGSANADTQIGIYSSADKTKLAATTSRSYVDSFFKSGTKAAIA